jgi:hypothetical protein
MWETGRGCEDEIAMNLTEVGCRMGVDRIGTGKGLVAGFGVSGGKVSLSATRISINTYIFICPTFWVITVRRFSPGLDHCCCHRVSPGI